MTLGAFGEDSPGRRQLAEALRELRRAADLTGEQLAARLEVSQSKISRVELGQSVPSVADVEAWTRETGASTEQRAGLLELLEATATEAVSWRRMRRGLADFQQETARLEASAGLIRVFQPLLVPGLLQTPGYARAVYLARHGDRPDIAGAVAARMNRQAILYEEGKRFEFVLTEAGLRWRMGGRDLLLAQFDRLGTVLTLPNVSLGIIPLGPEVPVWHSHGFNIFDDRASGPAVHVETLTSALNVRAEDVKDYLEAFTRLKGAAATGQDARALLERLAAELRQTAA